MTKEEALHQLASFKKMIGSSARAHIESERVLLEFLRDNGFADIAKAFNDVDEAVEFWYE